LPAAALLAPSPRPPTSRPRPPARSRSWRSCPWPCRTCPWWPVVQSAPCQFVYWHFVYWQFIYKKLTPENPFFTIKKQELAIAIQLNTLQHASDFKNSTANNFPVWKTATKVTNLSI
jgi:hypothetical protein